jgi:glycosyl hydrolase family 25
VHVQTAERVSALQGAAVTDALFVDCYQGDGRKDWRAFCAAGAPWHGAILKATQGDYYAPGWYGLARRDFLSAAGDRYGVDLWDGAYHYLDLSIDGAAQAEYFVRAVSLNGGEKHGTLWGMVDVERGGQRIQAPSRALVEDRVGSFARRYHEMAGRLPTLYGGELLRSLGVGGRMGCGRSAVALYGSALHGPHESTEQFLARTGTDLEHLLLWQYCGDGVASLPGYPTEAPGCGKIDISVLTLPGGLPALKSQLWAEAPAP